MARTQRWGLLLAVVACWQSLPAAAQQIHVATPLIGINDSFYEHINIGWGYRNSGRRGNWFVGFGGPNSVIPPFGGYDPNNDFRFGFGGSGFQFNLAASQGSNQSITMAAPSVTMMNGARGQIFSGSLRPFVTGLIPVVGDYPIVPYAPYPAFGAASPLVYSSPLTERLERLRNEGPARTGKAGAAEKKDDLVLGANPDAEKPEAAAPGGGSSSATRGDIGVAEIRRLHALEDEAKRKELALLVDEARTAERNGHLGLAGSLPAGGRTGNGRPTTRTVGFSCEAEAAAMNEFDPYLQWLGIPPHEQPADYYGLLGLRPFEADPIVIQSATDHRMALVRSYQTGPRGPYTQKLLNELAMAKLCLLDPFSKAEYDASLSTTTNGTGNITDAMLPASVSNGVTVTEPFAIVPNALRRSKSTTHRRSKIAAGKSHRGGWLPTLGMLVGLVVVLSLWGAKFIQDRQASRDTKPKTNQNERSERSH